MSIKNIIKEYSWVFPVIAALCGIILVIFGPRIGINVIEDIFSSKSEVPPAPFEFNAKLWRLEWIAYEPVNFDPERGIYPTEDEIAKDLEALRIANLSGIITFDSRNSLISVPRLAHQKGFEGVIMGIWDPTDKQSIELAIREADYVDGYSIGHNQLGIGYDLETLRKTMEFVRKKTGKPVSTTEYLANYQRVADYVNWLFPDVGGTWRKTSNESDTKAHSLLFDKFVEYVGESKTLADRYNKAVLLKMISFPSGGNPEFTEDAQNRFFKMVLNYQCGDINFPRSVSLSFFSAFDIAWKTPDRGWGTAEQYVGLFKRDRSPKPAANQFKEIPIYCMR